MTHASFRLLVCIPTHHRRGPFLREAMDSVLVQIAPTAAQEQRTLWASARAWKRRLARQELS